MIYRVNPALPPRARDERDLIAHLACEAACRAAFPMSGGGEQLLALHVLDQSTKSRAVEVAAQQAERISHELARRGIAHAPLGSGRRYARDCGGRITASVDAWARSWRRSVVECTPALPWDAGLRLVWGYAHPDVDRVVRALMGVALTPALPTDTDLENVLKVAVQSCAAA